jgi:hypothetical protein
MGSVKGFRKLAAMLVGVACVYGLAMNDPALGSDAIKAITAMVGGFLAINFASRQKDQQ